MMNITKEQLARLAPHYGHYDVDSGRILRTFVGRYNLSEEAFVGELIFGQDHSFDKDTPRGVLASEPRGAPEGVPQFSISSVLHLDEPSPVSVEDEESDE